MGAPTGNANAAATIDDTGKGKGGATIDDKGKGKGDATNDDEDKGKGKGDASVGKGKSESPTVAREPRCCPTCNGCGTVAGDVWVDTLEHWSQRLSSEAGIDPMALMEWSALYSASSFRKSQAMEILHKVLKKGDGEHAVRNPSAFIASACKDAWHTHDPAFSSSWDARSSWWSWSW